MGWWPSIFLEQKIHEARPPETPATQPKWPPVESVIQNGRSQHQQDKRSLTDHQTNASLISTLPGRKIPFPLCQERAPPKNLRALKQPPQPPKRALKQPPHPPKKRRGGREYRRGGSSPSIRARNLRPKSLNASSPAPLLQPASQLLGTMCLCTLELGALGADASEGFLSRSLPRCLAATADPLISALPQGMVSAGQGTL